MDKDVAFQTATLKEDVYIGPPAGYPPVAKGLVLKLNKALYSRLGNGTKVWAHSFD